MLLRELVDADGEWQAAGAQYVDNTEVRKSNFETNSLNAAGNFACRHFGIFFTIKINKVLIANK